MSPFGRNYQWRGAMRFLTYYMARRMLGFLARIIDQHDRRQAERRQQRLRAHPEGTHK